MPVLLTKNISETCFLSLWEITESIEQLEKLSLKFLDDEENTFYNALKNQHRKKEWLAVRALLTTMTGKFTRIKYDTFHKPYIEPDLNISITHSCNIVGILLSKKSEIGIDIEHISDKIARIALKFLEPEEILAIGEENKIRTLYVNWCAKEALYKMHGTKNLDFKNNMKILPFRYKDNGQITGKIITQEFEKTYILNYFNINNYIIVWSCL